MASMKFYNNGEVTFETEDENHIFRTLCSYYHAQKNKAAYIKRITETPDYETGERIITVFEYNGKIEFRVKF